MEKVTTELSAFDSLGLSNPFCSATKREDERASFMTLVISLTCLETEIKTTL